MIAKTALKRGKALFKDHEGVAAIEFALLLPTMMLACFGTMDVSEAVMANRKVTQLTSTLTDLTSRLASLPATEVDNIFNASKTVLMPYDWRKASMVITNIVIDENKIARVCWSRASGGGQALARGATVNIPDSVNTAKTSVIMATATYDYKPTVGYFFDNVFKLGGEPIYSVPRGAQALGTSSIEQVALVGTAPCPTF